MKTKTNKKVVKLIDKKTNKKVHSGRLTGQLWEVAGSYNMYCKMYRLQLNQRNVVCLYRYIRSNKFTVMLTFDGNPVISKHFDVTGRINIHKVQNHCLSLIGEQIPKVIHSLKRAMNIIIFDLVK